MARSDFMDQSLDITTLTRLAIMADGNVTGYAPDSHDRQSPCFEPEAQGRNSMPRFRLRFDCFADSIELFPPMLLRERSNRYAIDSFFVLSTVVVGCLAVAEAHRRSRRRTSFPSLAT